MPTDDPATDARGALGDDAPDVRLALLNAAQEVDPTRRNFERELDADLVSFHCPAGEIPDHFRFDGFVVTGSWASVYWDREWIGRLKTWVGDAVTAGLPALGVCYGHQLLADVLGGRVEAMGEYEIGYRQVAHDGESSLLAGVDHPLTVFTTHSDHVVEAPPGATVFARNDYGIHGFRTGRVFAVQFHPEYDMATARAVTRDKDDLADDRVECVLAGITPETYAAAREATRLFDNFLAFVVETRDETR
jgi:GMP synthase (glutamine-hydrolysing)